MLGVWWVYEVVEDNYEGIIRLQRQLIKPITIVYCRNNDFDIFIWPALLLLLEKRNVHTAQ